MKIQNFWISSPKLRSAPLTVIYIFLRLIAGFSIKHGCLILDSIIYYIQILYLINILYTYRLCLSVFFWHTYCTFGNFRANWICSLFLLRLWHFLAALYHPASSNTVDSFHHNSRKSKLPHLNFLSITKHPACLSTLRQPAMMNKQLLTRPHWLLTVCFWQIRHIKERKETLHVT